MKKFFEKFTSMMDVYGLPLSKERQAVWNVLANIDTDDLRKRPINMWDTKFLELVPVLHKYDEALEFLNTYSHVCNTYFMNLSDENVKSVAFQKALCKTKCCVENQKEQCCYKKLLHYFLSHWDFCDEVKEFIKNAPDKQDIVRFYNVHASFFVPRRKRL